MNNGKVCGNDVNVNEIDAVSIARVYTLLGFLMGFESKALAIVFLLLIVKRRKG